MIEVLYYLPATRGEGEEGSERGGRSQGKRDRKRERGRGSRRMAEREGETIVIMISYNVRPTVLAYTFNVSDLQ
jgi:hypothetical protein